MPETITSSDAHYAYDLVQTICAEVGPGLPGSPQERERAAIIRRELELHLGAGNVAVEEFAFAPAGFLSVYPLSGLGLLLAVLLNLSTGRLPGVSPWLTAPAALAFAVLAPLPFIFQFILNYELVDRFLPQKQSLNVIGTLRRPETENVRRLLILSGHHDSAPANTWFGLLGDVKRRLMPGGRHDRAREDAWLRRLGNGFYFLSTICMIGFVTLIALSIIQLAGLIAGDPGLVRAGTLGWVLLAFPVAPAIIFSLCFNRGRKGGGIVPGAADNLSACAVAVALCRFLVRNPSCIPAGTEIRFISFGAEEAGVRGSRRYAARHLAELQRLDARLLNFETLANPEVAILTAEGNGAVKVAPEMLAGVVAAAERAGVPYKVKAPSLGENSDAAPFAQAGLKAITLLGLRMPEGLIAFYHQKWDRPGDLAIEPMLNALQLALEWIRCNGD